jgi:DNA helicase II / ATP-dependent DNA helicase PcrA
MTHRAAGSRRPRPPDRSSHRLLDRLTVEQVKAVCHGRGPLLIVAGPGTGKTRTLTHRVAHLLGTGVAAPHEILAVTFSVRAAGELRLRLADLLGEDRALGVTAATFHSVCARLLRRHAGLFRRTDAYTIYDQADLRRVIDWLLADQRRTEIQQALARCGQPPAAEIEAQISLAKSRLAGPDSYTRRARHPARELIAAVWRASETELQRSNAFSFDDLLVFAVRLLFEHPARLRHIRGRWPWIAVDEMQDTNPAQAALVHLLAGPDGNITCVGDDDQSVYGWRAAQPRNMVAFAEHYPGHARIVLGRNFRSRAEILHAAGACVAHNAQRLPKRLIAMRGTGGRVETRAFADEHAEAAWVAGLAADTLAAGTPPSEVLLLARTGFATAALQRALAAGGIPHRVLGSLGLYERAEVRDALAYLTLLANPADAQAFRRAVQAPRRGIGPATARLIVDTARERFAGDLIAACAAAHTLDGIRSAPVRARLASFGAGLKQIRADLRAGRSLGHVVVATVTLDGGLVAHQQHRRDHSPRPDERRDAERVLEDLRSLCRAAHTHAEQHEPAATLGGFLEHAAGLHAQELEAGEDHRITVSTIHRAKGAEAALVVLLACEEQLLPSWRALESADPEQLAEERRLFYVAATRAKDQLVFTRAHARARRPTAGASRFLAEAGLLAGPDRLAA